MAREGARLAAFPRFAPFNETKRETPFLFHLRFQLSCAHAPCIIVCVSAKGRKAEESATGWRSNLEMRVVKRDSGWFLR